MPRTGVDSCCICYKCVQFGADIPGFSGSHTAPVKQNKVLQKHIYSEIDMYLATH